MPLHVCSREKKRQRKKVGEGKNERDGDRGQEEKGDREGRLRKNIENKIERSEIADIYK